MIHEVVIGEDPPPKTWSPVSHLLSVIPIAIAKEMESYHFIVKVQKEMGTSENAKEDGYPTRVG